MTDKPEKTDGSSRYGNWREQPLIGSPGIERELPEPMPAVRTVSPQPGARPVAVHVDEPLEVIGVEPDEVNVRPVVRFLIGTGVFLAVSFVVVTALISLVTNSVPQFHLPLFGVAPIPEVLPHSVVARADPSLELRELRATSADALNGYSFIDKAAGVVSIPIDRAIDLTLERGLPTRPSAVPLPAEPASPSDASSGRTVVEGK